MIEPALYFQLGVFVAIAIAFGFSRYASFFHPLTFYLLFHFIVFVLRPFMIYYFKFENEWIYMGFTPTPDQFNYTLFVTTIGLIVFTIVCWITGRTEPDFSKVDFAQHSSARNQAMIWTWALLGPLAIYSAFFAPEYAGPDTVGGIQMTQDMVTGATVYVNTTGYLVDAQTMFSPLVVMLMWRYRFALWTWVPLLVFILYRAFLGGGRWPMITTTLTVILLQLLRSRKKWFQIRYIVVLFPLFFLFQSIGADRNLFRDFISDSPRARQMNVKIQDNKTWLQKQDNPDFANFEFLTVILWAVPDKSHTYSYFTQYLQLFTEPVPRILWPEKPIGPPIRLINMNDFANFYGLTDALVGDGWKSAGYIGVIITISIVAFVLGLFHRRFWQQLNNPPSVIFYCTFLPLTITWFRDGSISIFKSALFTVFPIIIWQGFTRLFEELERGRDSFMPRVRQPRDRER